jgi:hypothetical protein
MPVIGTANSALTRLDFYVLHYGLTQVARRNRINCIRAAASSVISHLALKRLSHPVKFHAVDEDVQYRRKLAGQPRAKRV